jgi:hypothetical protein
MPCPENIIPPKPGEVRNPNGRGKGTKNRSTILKKWLKTKITIKHPETKEDMKVTLADAIALGILKEAVKGNVAAFKEINDTLYGKIKDEIEHSGGINLHFDHDDENL